MEIKVVKVMLKVKFPGMSTVVEHTLVGFHTQKLSFNSFTFYFIDPVFHFK